MNHENKYLDLMERVRVLMDWPHDKAMIWMSTANPLLGNIEPAMIIIKNRGARLEKFIEEAEQASSTCAEDSKKDT